MNLFPILAIVGPCLVYKLFYVCLNSGHLFCVEKNPQVALLGSSMIDSNLTGGEFITYSLFGELYQVLQI
jgi:hypothetical protein